MRPDIEVADLALLLEQLQAIQVGDPQRSGQLRHRYLTLVLEALQLPATSPLPGPPPTPQELRRRYDG